MSGAGALSGVRFPEPLFMRYKLLGALVVLAVAGTGSATLLDVYGTVSGTADVRSPVSFEEVYYNSNVEGQYSGEYVLLVNNLGSINLSNWALKSADQRLDLESGLTESNRIVLFDNSTGEATASLPSDKRYELLPVGNLADQGLSTSENLEMIYEPGGDTIAAISYDSPDCDSSEAFIPSEDKCMESELEIEEVSSN